MRLEYFQLVDRIVVFNPADRTIRAEARVPTDSTIFEGHFPDHPLMPGVLLIEAMAQTSGWLVIGLNRFDRMCFLAAVKDAKFRRFVAPGEILTLDAALVHEGSGYAVTKAKATVTGAPVCECEIRLRVMPFPNEKFRTSMKDVATRILFPMETLADG